MIRTIFLDMDGVIVDLVAGLQKSFPDWDGVPPIHDHLFISEDDFWRKMIGLGTHWWSDLPEFPWSKQLVETCEKVVGPENVYILTSPGRTCVTTATGKLYWLQNHFPQFLREGRVVIGSQKWLLAAPDRLLIDDTPQKCQDFMSAGGWSILVPGQVNNPRTLIGPDGQDYPVNLTVDEIIETLRMVVPRSLPRVDGLSSGGLSDLVDPGPSVD